MTNLRAFTLLLAALVLMPAAASAATWSVDPSKSSIAFVGGQMGVPVEGSFETFTASIDFDPARPQDAAIVVEVDMTSVRLPVADVEAEIKKEKWFDVAKYPVGRFEATSVEAKGDGAYLATGKLTLRDSTQDVSFPFTLELADDGAAQRAIARGEIQVNRLAFGIGTGEWGDPTVVAEEVGIRIEITGTRPK